MENVTSLVMGMCILINLPEERVDCDEAHNCVGCRSVGKFISGEGLDDHSSSGHVTCLVLTALTVLVGLGATFMSSLIITVLRRRGSRKSFDILLTVLAHVDLLGAFMGAVCTTSMVVFWQNWDRGFVTLLAYVCSALIVLFARSASVFMTLVISVERYLVVAYPLKARYWFSPGKTKLIAGSIVAFAALVTLLPGGSGVIIGENRFGEVASVRGIDYLAYTSPLDGFWRPLKGIRDLADFWVFFPLLIIFNGLIFYHIRKAYARRAELNVAIKKDLRATKLVAPVVAVLLFCNIEPVITFYFLFTRGILYREGFVGIFLSVAINSAANLPIYYVKGPGFKEEVRVVLREWFSCCARIKSSDGGAKTAGLMMVHNISNPSAGSSC